MSTTTTTTTRRRWTDETIDSELRAQCAELGHFPTRTELVARGLRSLWDAMRASDGVDAWRDRLETAPAVSHDDASAASHEEIAARAYELYERGAPGDHFEHWLAAENELRGA
jgi:hypothetical protein